MHGVQVRRPSPKVTWEQFVWRLRRGCVQCRAGEGTALNNRATASKAVNVLVCVCVFQCVCVCVSSFFCGCSVFLHKFAFRCSCAHMYLQQLYVHTSFVVATYAGCKVHIYIIMLCVCVYVDVHNRGPHQVVWLPGKARVAASARGLIDFLMIGGQAPSPCQYQGFGLAAAASLWPPPRTTIDSPPAPSLFGLLAMCQNPLAQSSATIERDHFRFIFLALLLRLHSRLLSLPLSFVLFLHLLILLRPAKMKREAQRKRSNL